MPLLFISYRRDDSPDTVKLIYEHLTSRLPRWEIFYDHESLPLGERFPERCAKVAAAAVVLVIIGPKWLSILKERKGAGVDHVRAEVRLGLEAGASVVPILVGRAVLPAAADLVDFPDLLPLLQLNAQPVRPDPDFDGDLEHVIVHLKQLQSEETVGATLADKYTLIEEIGQGGMGLVYLAQQKQPVKRVVAVKLIKPGMDSRDVLARFDAERQALAVMDHPNIARVLDAGVAVSGRPFFVMEYVRGVPLTEYCDRKRLTPQERLNLFIPVCHAVQHAHQKGIIHRDLKPSNVLVEEVDGKPVPKVIDFGLAKVLGHRLTDKTLLTTVETRVGTLEYSAPEQAAGRSFDVDTRSDIYSLGIMLYELLTGAPPFTHEELLKIGEEEMRRVIREVEPTRPSKKLSSSGELPAIASNRQLDPRKLTRMVQGDLDWIVMKCLEKEQARRYATATELAQDLKSFLLDEPVQAGPPSAAYRLRKLLRRNKGPVIAAALVLLTLIGGILGTSIGLYQAEVSAEAEREARKKAEKATQAATEAAEAERTAKREAEQRRHQAEKLALQAQFDQFYFRGREQPDVAMVGSAQLLPEALKLRDQALADSISLHLGAWAQGVHRLHAVCAHQGAVEWLAFSPDGKTLLTGSEDNTARLWEAATGKQLGPALQHQDAVRAVAFSPDGKTVLTGSGDQTARLWEAATGKQLGPPLQHQGPVAALAFSPDGMIVLTGSWDKTARLWEAATGRQLGPPLQHQDAVFAVAFSPDGKTVLTGGGDKTARLWEAATGKQLGLPLQHQDSVWAVAFSPDGKTVLTGSGYYLSRSGNARLWDVATGKPLGAPLHHLRSVGAVAFSPDGKTVLTGSGDRTARLWEVVTGKPLRAPLEHQGSVLAVAFSPDSKTVLTGSGDKTAQLWEVVTGKPLGAPLEHQDIVRAVAFSPDGRTVLTGSGDGTARLWEVVPGKQIGVPLQHQSWLNAVAFSPDGKTVLTGSGDKTARLWEAATGKQLGPPLQHQDWVGAVAFSPDGKTVLTGSEDKTARLWEAATGKQLGAPLQHQEAVFAVAFSPDGKTVLTGCGDYTARLWEVATGKHLRSSLQHQGPIIAVAFSPDGRTVLTGSMDKTARLWEAATGKQLGRPLQHQAPVRAVAFSPDGKTVLTGSEDKTARLWKAGTGKQLGPLLQHKQEVYAVAFSPDGRTVLTGSGDNTAQLWEAATGRQLGPPLQHQGPVRAVAFSPDGRTVLTGSADKTARLWSIAKIQGAPEKVILWSQVITGLELDEHGLQRVLDGPTWHARRERLLQLGGSPFSGDLAKQ